MNMSDVQVQDRVQALIEAVQKADSASRLTDAVRDLAELGAIAAIPTLIEALGYNNPGAAVAAVDGLVAIGKPAVVSILEQLDGYNYGARAWALRALAGIGDPRGLNFLLETAEKDFALSVRRAAARGLGNIHWDDMEPERVPEAQRRVHQSLTVVCQDPEWVVRYAGVVGLQGLGTAVVNSQPAEFGQILERLQAIAKTDADLSVRGRAQLAIQELSGIS
jgi:phycocyanobilin lyase beta subunit